MAKSKTVAGGTTRPVYELPKLNGGLGARGGLRDLQDPEPKPGTRKEVFEGSSYSETWVDPVRLERLMHADTELRAGLRELLDDKPGERVEVGSRREKALLAEAERHVTRLFEETLLPEIVERFEAVKGLVCRYVVAKEAARPSGSKTKDI